MKDMQKKIAEVNALLASAPKLKGTWEIETDDAGEIAICRDSRGTPIGFMNADDFRALKKSTP